MDFEALCIGFVIIIYQNKDNKYGMSLSFIRQRVDYCADVDPRVTGGLMMSCM